MLKLNVKCVDIYDKKTSLDKNGEIMSLRHKTYKVRGVQFHPESVLTPKGKKMIKNWVKSI